MGLNGWIKQKSNRLLYTYTKSIQLNERNPVPGIAMNPRLGKVAMYTYSPMNPT